MSAGKVAVAACIMGAYLAAYVAIDIRNQNRTIKTTFNDLEMATMRAGLVNAEFNCAMLGKFQESLNDKYDRLALEGSNEVP